MCANVKRLYFTTISDENSQTTYPCHFINSMTTIERKILVYDFFISPNLFEIPKKSKTDRNSLLFRARTSFL